MKDLIYKEFKLAWTPSVFYYLLFGMLLLIPAWLYFIAFGYIFIAFVNTFFIGRANQDIIFTVSLPIPKKDMVRARVFTVAIIEVLQIAFAIPFAIISSILYSDGNVLGMDTNAAFFGFVFVMYAIFNAIFLPMFFKTAYKVGMPTVLGVIASGIFAMGVEFAVQAVPILKTNLDTMTPNHLANQLPVLLAGIGIFSLVTWLAGKKAVKNFEKVDL